MFFAQTIFPLNTMYSVEIQKTQPFPPENVISPIFQHVSYSTFFSEKKIRNIGVPTVLQEYECGARRLTRMASLQAKLRVEHGINARMHMEHTPSLAICEWSTDYARGAGCFVRTCGRPRDHRTIPQGLRMASNIQHGHQNHHLANLEKENDMVYPNFLGPGIAGFENWKIPELHRGFQLGKSSN
jgi:hypothetical protein